MSLLITYGYKVSLRIDHPSMDPALITAALGMSPTNSWLVGEPRRNLKGAPLKGTSRVSFWTARLVDGRSDVKTLPAAVAEAATHFESNRDFFRRIREEGGSVEFFIGWFFGEGQGGDVFGPELLLRLGDLGIALSFDVYPPDPDAMDEGAGQ